MEFPRPGVVGTLIRLAIALAAGSIAYDAIVHAPSYWDGFTGPREPALLLAILTAFSAPMVNELVLRPWRFWPAILLGLGALLAAGIGAREGDAWGPVLGRYTGAWAILWSAPLALALLLAAAMRTPGCEFNAFRRLLARLKGKGSGYRTCPGLIDRFDDVRLFGRW